MTIKNKKVAEALAEINETSIINGKKNSKYKDVDYKKLLKAIVTDKDWVVSKKGKKAANELIDNPAKKMDKFLHKFLKHAGITDESYRQSLIDSFEFSEKDIDFLVDALDELIYCYTSAGKVAKILESYPIEISLIKDTNTDILKVRRKKNK